MIALFSFSGTTPDCRLVFQRRLRGVEITALQFLSRIAGKPSGPAAAIDDSSSIAASRSSLRTSINSIVGPEGALAS